MTTTAANITDGQIDALRADAAIAGDFDMVDICDTAVPCYTSVSSDAGAIEAARAECARVISDAEAQT